MTNPGSLSEWAQTHFRNIHFNFCPLNDHELHVKTLQARFEQGTIMKNTRQYHCFEPVNNKILCRLFSKDSVFAENVISGKRNKKSVLFGAYSKTISFYAVRLKYKIILSNLFIKPLSVILLTIRSLNETQRYACKRTARANAAARVAHR